MPIRAPAAAIAGLIALAAALPASAQDRRPFQRIEDLSAFSPLATIRGAAREAPVDMAAPGLRTVSPEALAKAQAYSDANGGKALMVWQGGRVRYEAYAPGVTSTSLLNVFSMTKSVLGLVYGAALRDGVIASLDDPVGRYLAEWKDDPRGSITLRRLLSMSSGLTLYSLAAPDGRAFAMTYGPDITRMTLETPAAQPPGQVFEYNNVDPQLAGMALDRALRARGDSYVDYLSRALWVPLGQGDAKTWLEHKGGEPRFFSGLMASPRDWLRLGLLIKNHGRAHGRQVLPAGWIDTMTAPSKTNPNYGLLVWMGQPYRTNVPGGPTAPSAVYASAPYQIPDLIFFNGALGQRVYISRALDLVIVRMGEQRPGWDDAIIPNAIAGGLELHR